MVIDTQIANSRNSRPTMPPISSSGMNTAISEKLIETMVKPISPAPLMRGVDRLHAVFDVAEDVLQHHDRIVHHEADGDRQAHQRQVVQAEAAQVHRAQRAGERHWDGDAGNDRRPQVAQEQEDHHHHQRDRRASG